MPRWKVCGACLSAGTLEVLDRAGLLAPRDGVPLRHLRLTAGSSEARVPLKGSMAVSRRSFDQALLDAAQEEGVAVMTPTSLARPHSPWLWREADWLAHLNHLILTGPGR